MKLYPAIVVRPPHPDPAFEDLLLAALDGSGATAIDEPTDGAGLRAFFQTETARGAAMQTLRDALPGARLEIVDVSDENWAERSQASLRAIRAGALTIAPPWDIPSDAAGVIVILPSMGFGTGHHATTRLCLMALQNVGARGKSVLDVGTGSGVLALAAAKLGAPRVVGIDNDADAIANATENRALNDLDVTFRSEDLQNVGAGGAFDLVLANLTGGVLINHATTLEALTVRGGFLILSGMREEEESDVKRAFRAKLEERAEEEGWICLVLRREA